MLPRVIATGWLVLEVTDSPFWVGAIFGIEGLVMLACGGLGGVVAARVERRRTLAAVQAVFALVLIAVAGLSALGMLRLWHLVIAAVLTGAGRCLHIPLSTGLLQRAAGQGQLMRALGARALTFNIGKMAGSALVGVTISAFGFAAAFPAPGGDPGRRGGSADGGCRRSWAGPRQSRGRGRCSWIWCASSAIRCGWLACGRCS